MKQPQVYLRTFANQCSRYEKPAVRLIESALKSGLIADGQVWCEDDVRLARTASMRDLTFLKAHPKGFGYWLWKPILILHTLESIPDGAILVYLDAGCEVNLRRPRPRERLRQYFEFACQQGIAAFDTGLPIVDWTKPEVFQRLGISRVPPEVNQVGGGGLIICNGPKSRRVVSSWLDYCRMDDGELLEDPIVDHPDHTNPRFRAHRHDQALLSIIYWQEGLKPLPQEFWFGSSVRMWRRLGAPFPFWASRSRRAMPMFGTTTASAFVVYPRAAARWLHERLSHRASRK